MSGEQREDRIDQEDSRQQRNSTNVPHEVARCPSVPPSNSDKSNKLRSNEFPDATRTLIRTSDEGQYSKINHEKISLQEYYVPMAEEGPCFQSSQISSEDNIGDGVTGRGIDEVTHQRLILPKTVHHPNQVGVKQAATFSYAPTAPEPSKVNTKKNGMSRSCPPLKRDVSPITKTGRNISHDRNHKQAQIFVLGKLKESFQSEGKGNKSCPVEEVDDPQDEPTAVADPPVPMEIQTVQDDIDSVDTQKILVDLVSKFEQEEAGKHRERREGIIDATHKW